MDSYVQGHHFVEILCLFLSYRERMPPHRNKNSADIGKTLAREWIGTANGVLPWEEHRVGEGEHETVAIFDDPKVVVMRTKEEDERVSREEVWGERRYEGLEVMRALKGPGVGDESRGRMMASFLCLVRQLAKMVDLRLTIVRVVAVNFLPLH